MPVITIVVPGGAGPDLAGAVADAVAGSLGLGDGDVIATVVPSGPAVASGGGDASWVTVTIHGGDRGPEPVERAASAAADAVRGWADEAGAPLDGVWTEWVTPVPARSSST